jgi:hypothetical protein
MTLEEHLVLPLYYYDHLSALFYWVLSDCLIISLKEEPPQLLLRLWEDSEDQQDSRISRVATLSDKNTIYYSIIIDFKSKHNALWEGVAN